MIEAMADALASPAEPVTWDYDLAETVYAAIEGTVPPWVVEVQPAFAAMAAQYVLRASE